MSDEQIWIVTAKEDYFSGAEQSEGGKGGDSSGNPWKSPQKVLETMVEVRKVSANKLETELSKFLKVMANTLNNAQESISQQTGFKLDEIELSVEITGEGEVKLLGTGVKAGTKGGLTLKFKKE
jgi:hypothetical protein